VEIHLLLGHGIYDYLGICVNYLSGYAVGNGWVLGKASYLPGIYRATNSPIDTHWVSNLQTRWSLCAVYQHLKAVDQSHLPVGLYETQGYDRCEVYEDEYI
jgi:hypothetical protein